MRSFTAFSSEHSALAYAFAAVVSLASLPLLGWHYWQLLSGLGVLAIGGLLLTDLVLWFSTHWSVTAHSGAMRATAIGVKLTLSLIMVCNAAVVVIGLQSGQSVASAARLQSELRAAEIAARAAAAKDLAATTGGRSAAREAMKLTDNGPSVEALTTGERSRLDGLVPAWWREVGVFVLPPISGILGFALLTVVASVVRRRETLAELMGETIDTDAVSPALPARTSAMMAMSTAAPAHLRAADTESGTQKTTIAAHRSAAAEVSDGVSGSGLPSLPGVTYEKTSRGGVEIWRGSGPRRNRQYIGFIGKKRLADDPAEIAAFIRRKLAEK